jgi:hypothetical protein
LLRPIGDLDQYKYVLADIVFSKKGSNDSFLLLAKNLDHISIINKYTENVVPVINIVANVEKALYKELTVSEGLLSIKIILHKFIANSAAQAKQLVINKTFSVLNEYDFQLSEVGTLDGDKTTDNVVNATSTGQLIQASFYLIDKDNLTNYRDNLSISLDNSSLTNALALSFKQRGFTSVLMNKIPDEYNGKIFTPTGNLLASLEYLNHKYGIFNTDYIFYMDSTRNYLLDKVNLGKALKDGEISSVNLYLEENASVYGSETGSTMQQDTAIVNLVEPPDVLKLDNYTEYMDGSSILSVDSNYTQLKLDGGTGSIEKAIFVQNHKVSKQIQHRSKELKNSLTVKLTNVDYAIVAPNLIYNVIPHPSFEAVHPIKGKYRLHQSMISITKGTEETMNMDVTLVLRKIVI